MSPPIRKTDMRIQDSHCCFAARLLLLLFAAHGFVAATAADARSGKPNIVLIISDDLSWGDLGCYGQKQILTPNIDRLAKEGMRFTNAYAGNSVCAPSRSCLMQGLHPGHARVRGNAYRSYREGLAKDDVTIAEILKGAGYATGLFGVGSDPFVFPIATLCRPDRRLVGRGDRYGFGWAVHRTQRWGVFADLRRHVYHDRAIAQSARTAGCRPEELGYEPVLYSTRRGGAYRCLWQAG